MASEDALDELREAISPGRINRPSSYYIDVAKRLRSLDGTIKPSGARDCIAALRAVRGERYCYCWTHQTDAAGNLTHTPECRDAMRLTGCEYGE